MLSPAPEFEFDKDHTYFMCRLPIHPQSKPPVEMSSTAVTPQVRRLAVEIKGEMTRDGLQSAIGLSDRKSFREIYLEPAIKQGLVEMTIPEKPNSRLEKYRLTIKGISLLQSREGK